MKKNNDIGIGQRILNFLIKFLVIIVLIGGIFIAIFVLKKYHNNKNDELLSLETLEKLDNVSIEYDKDNSTPYIISGNFLKNKVNSIDEAISELNNLKSLYGISDPKKEFKVVNTVKIDNQKYYRLQQYYKDVLVEGCQIIFDVSSNGDVNRIVSTYNKNISNINIVPKIEKEELENIIEEELADDINLEETELVITNDEEDNMILTWKTLITVDSLYDDTDFTESCYIYLNAKDGEIIKAVPIGLGLLATAENQKNEIVDINISKNNDEYLLFDEERNIQIYELNNSNKINDNNPVTSNDKNKWDNTTAVSTLNNIAKIYDYFDVKEKIDVLNGEKLNIYLNYKKYKKNALACFENDIPIIILGTDGEEYADTIDALAHEYMHVYVSMVMHNGQRNGFDMIELDEGFADVIGNIIQNYYFEKSKLSNANENLTFENDPNLSIGETLSSIHIRNRQQANPEEDNCPSAVNGKYYSKTNVLKSWWVNAVNNNGGNLEEIDVHKNACVISHLAYLMWKDGFTTDEIFHIYTRSVALLNSGADYTQVTKAFKSIIDEAYPDKSSKFVSECFEIGVVIGKNRIKSSVSEISNKNEDDDSKSVLNQSNKTKNKVKIDFDFSEYESHGEFGEDGIAWVTVSDYSGIKKGYIRSNGEWVIPLTDKIRTCRDYEDGIVAVTYNPIDKNTGEMYTRINYGEVKIFDTSGTELASIPQNGQIGYGGDWSTKVFNNGNMLLENPYYDRYFYVRSTGEFFEMGEDKNGNNNNVNISECGDYSDGYLFAVKGSNLTAGGARIWFVDEYGQTALICSNDQNSSYKNVYEALDFKNGKSTVLFQGQNLKYYTVTIDKQGNWLDEPIELDGYEAIRKNY